MLGQFHPPLCYAEHDPSLRVIGGIVGYPKSLPSHLKTLTRISGHYHLPTRGRRGLKHMTVR
jgi:hypothetical protein